MRLTLAAASLRRHQSRTMLAVLGVAVAAAMLLDMVMLSGGMRESFRELLLSKGFQLRVSPKGTLPFDTDAMIANASGIVARIRTNPDAELISPVLGATAYIPNSDGAVSVFALGIDPSQQGDYELVTGHDVTTPDALVANNDFFVATHARIGDTVDLAIGYDPQMRAFASRRRMVVAGRARFLYTSSSQPAVALPLTTLQAMGGPSRTDHVSLFMIKARTGADVETDTPLDRAQCAACCSHLDPNRTRPSG